MMTGSVTRNMARHLMARLTIAGHGERSEMVMRFESTGVSRAWYDFAECFVRYERTSEREGRREGALGAMNGAVRRKKACRLRL